MISDLTSKKDSAKKMFEHILAEENITLVKKVPLKVHFGERGNITYNKPEFYDGIIDSIEERGSESAYIETNVLYKGARTIKKDHLVVAAEHGFTRLPVIIADGDYGEDFSHIPLDFKHFKDAYIGKEFEPFNQIVVCSHFKGHSEAGFGGALKQLSMGFAARGGKMAQHSNNVPVVSIDKCTACDNCAKHCPVDAITVDEYAVIDESLCIGCAACVGHCHFGAMNPDWGANENFLEKVAEYAYAAQKNKEFIYITFVLNITEECDCYGIKMKPVVQDIGILGSTDPVALDQACYDLVREHKGNKTRMWEYFDKGAVTLKYSEESGTGTRDYKLIKL
jgi:uncharacterized Fe-S center protein